MKAPRTIVVVLVIVFALSFITGFAQAGPGQKQEQKKPEAKQPQREVLPKEIKAAVLEGLTTRQGRQDIPVTIFKSLVFPVQGGMHAIFFFKVKNADLGYAAPAPAAPAAKNQPAPPAPAPGMLEARLGMAIELFQPDETGALKSTREYLLPVNLQTEANGYDPNKEEWYTIGFPQPFGKYTVAMVLSPVDPKKGIVDVKKLGICYYDIVLPGPETYAGALETSPIFLVRRMESMPTYEQRPTVHKGLFTFSVLQIVPNIDNVVTAEDKGQIEPIFFILGAKPKEEPAQLQSLPTQQEAKPQQPKYDIEVNFEVQKEDGSLALKWQSQNYPNPLVDQALPLKKTLSIKDEKGTERKEERSLEPGKYNLVVRILDKVSQLKLEKKVPFEIK